MPVQYPQAQSTQIRPEVNAVKIELVNPQAYGTAPETPAFQPAPPALMAPPAYAPNQMPIYAYPQGQIYPVMTAPMAPIQSLSPMPFMPQQPLLVIEKKEPSEPKQEAKVTMVSAPEPPPANFVPIKPEKKEAPPALIDKDTPVVEEKKAQTETKEKPAEDKKDGAPAAVNTTIAAVSTDAPQTAATAAAPAAKPEELPKAEEAAPAVDLKPIVGSLKSEDMDEQFMAIQQIAELGQNPKMPSDLLLNEDVFNNLNGIITKDTSNMQGPTAEQEELRNKKFSGEALTPEQDSLAESLAPQEVAEMNKMFATYSLAIAQKNFRESVNKEASKQGLEPVKLNEIPEMETVVENIKSNPNPLIREASISALAYVAKPEDKETMEVILSVASNDPDPMVKEAANKAQEKLNQNN